MTKQKKLTHKQITKNAIQAAVDQAELFKQKNETSTRCRNQRVSRQARRL